MSETAGEGILRLLPDARITMRAGAARGVTARVRVLPLDVAAHRPIARTAMHST